MSEIWYYADEHGKVGPLTLQELQGTLTTVQNADDVFVWCNRFSDWKRAKDVPELNARIVLPPPAPHSEGRAVKGREGKVFCSRCGTALVDTVTFCSQCGNRISPTDACVTAPRAPPPNLIDQLPSRLEELLSEILEPNETVHIKLKGAFAEALVCTNRRVLILKAGYMTGQTFGSNVFQAPYRNITGVQVKKHLITGYFELSAGGVQNQPTSYWQTGQGDAAKRENCISLNSSDAFPKFREASSFILSRVDSPPEPDREPSVDAPFLHASKELTVASISILRRAKDEGYAVYGGGDSISLFPDNSSPPIRFRTNRMIEEWGKGQSWI